VSIALVLGWLAVFERRSPATIGFNANAFVRFIRGYLIGCAMLVFAVGTIWLLGGYHIENTGAWAAPAMATFLPIVGYLIGFVIQGSSEEVLFRGWLMQTVASRHGIVIAIIINSLLFGAAHLLNIKPSPAMYAGCANVALFGIFISLYACRDRSLWGVCGWHGAWNWLLGIGFGLEVSGLHMGTKPLIVDLADTAGAQWWLTGAEWGPEASVVTTGMLLAGIVFLIWKGALKPGESYVTPAPDATF
jgi:membrane protease YdiL (CAAX protease family)